MKFNWKKILIVSVLTFVIGIISIVTLDRLGYDFKVLSNDSGFDADYDSGDYGGGYDSGYDGGYDSDYGSSSGNGNSEFSFREFIRVILVFIAVSIPILLSIKAENYLKYINTRFLSKFLLWFIAILSFISGCFGAAFVAIPNPFILILYVVTLLPALIAWILSKFKKNNYKTKTLATKYKDVSSEILKNINCNDINELKDEIYNNYVAIQIAWMNNKIDDVRHLLADDLFNSYKSQLVILSNKNQQNIMSDFKYIDSKVYNIRKVPDGFLIESTLEVICKDYIIDVSTKNVLRGSDHIKKKYLYNLKFKIGSKTIENCPSCFAKLPDKGTSVKCSYCGNIVVRNSDNLVLINKKMIKQQNIK